MAEATKTKKAKREVPNARYTEAQITDFVKKAPGDWPAFNEAETKIALRVLSSSGKIERPSASKVEYDELHLVLKARAKDGDKEAIEMLRLHKELSKRLQKELPDDKHYVNARFGKADRGFLYVAENWRKDGGDKNKMVPFEEYGGKPVPTLR